MVALEEERFCLGCWRTGSLRASTGAAEGVDSQVVTGEGKHLGNRHCCKQHVGCGVVETADLLPEPVRPKNTEKNGNRHPRGNERKCLLSAPLC